MYEIKNGSRFKKSFKRLKRSGNFRMDLFEDILSFLVQGQSLPDKYHDHNLGADFAGYKECHLTGDCVLIYKVDHTSKYVRLVNIGNHANMFE